jgi:predicted metal-dependent hydrolase
MKIDKIIRSKRKSVALIVDVEGRLIVRAPKRASKRKIEALVQEQGDWIRTKQAQAKHEYELRQPRPLVDGEAFYYLGELLPLVIVDRKDPPLLLNGRFELSRHHRSTAEQVFIAWYREQARELIGRLVDKIATSHGYKHQGVRITGARTRWGSCNSRGGLNFSWRLVMLPPEIIEYVILHELVHTEIQNHSKAFWHKLDSGMPDSQVRRRWLRDNGWRYHFP